MQLVVEDGNPHQDSSGTQGADGQILERTFDGAFIVVPECGQRHGGEGHDLDHDEDVEQVAREHQAQHGAGEHEEQAEVVGLAVIVCHIGEGIDAGGKHGDRDDQAEEQAQRVHFDADTDGPAGHRCPVAQPISNDFAIHHDRLDEQEHENHSPARDDK